MSLNVVCGATPIVIPDGSYKYRNSIVRFHGSYEHRNSIFRVRPILADKVVFYAKLSEVQKWTLFAPSVFYIIFELPCTSVESYARLYVNTSIIFFRMIRRPHVPPTRYQVLIQQQVVLLLL